MPVQEKKFLSEHGYQTYATAHEERTRREINAKFADDKADVQAYAADAKADIAQHSAQATAAIDAASAAAVSHIDQYAPQVHLTEEEWEQITPEVGTEYVIY